MGIYILESLKCHNSRKVNYEQTLELHIYVFKVQY